MADKGYSNLTIIVATSKDCSKCARMKSTQAMDMIIKGFKAKGMKVVEKECETRATNIPYPPTNRLNEFLNVIVGWFPQFIILPTSYYNNIDRHSVDELIDVSKIFNGIYKTKDDDGNPLKDDEGNIIKGKTVATNEYGSFTDANFTKFFDKYLSSPTYKGISVSSTSVGPGTTSTSLSRPTPNYTPAYTPTYSSAPRIGANTQQQQSRLGSGVGAGPTGLAPSFGSNANGQRGRTSGLEAPAFTEPANKNEQCSSLGFVLFKR